MANHKSALKRNRQNEKRNVRNTSYRTRVKTHTKNVLKAVEADDAEAAKKSLHDAEALISKVASKGVIHPRAASRKISGLAKRVHQMSAAG